jgi:L-lysine exporter family protein LysE/ArgO
MFILNDSNDAEEPLAVQGLGQLPTVGCVEWTGALAAAGAGLIFGLSLIIVIGPQNAFVLREGLRGQYVALVVLVCSISDVALIAGGVGGAGSVLAGRHWLLTAATVAGAGFLLGYGVLAGRRVLRPAEMAVEHPGRLAAWRAVLLTCLAFTWLNPGVYVDTVFLIAPVSQAHAPQQWWFALGAMVSSVGWFAALGYGARSLSGVFARPSVWRVVDGTIAAIMFATAVRLVVQL